MIENQLHRMATVMLLLSAIYSGNRIYATATAIIMTTGQPALVLVRYQIFVTKIASPVVDYSSSSS